MQRPISKPSFARHDLPSRHNVPFSGADGIVRVADPRLRVPRSKIGEVPLVGWLLLLICVGLPLSCGGGDPSPIKMLNSVLSDADVAIPYKAVLSATGGVPPYLWSIETGVLPAGLRLQASTGTIAGSATVVGSYPFTAMVADSTGHSASQGFTLAVLPASSTVPVTVQVTPTTVTVPSGGTQQFVASVSGALNHGVTWGDCAGSITQSGLWTAPVLTTASQQGDCVYAISQADPSKMGEAYAFVTPTTNDCLPPTYACLYAGIDTQLPGPPPFSTATPANTVVRLPDLSKAKMVRITDSSFGTLCAPWSATHSGGDYDVISNTTGTMLLVTCGGSAAALGFNPTTLKVTNLSQAQTSFKTLNKCTGSPAWSRTEPNLLFCKPQANEVTPLGITTGTQLYSLTFPFATGNLCGTGDGTCPDPTKAATWRLVFDFALCPEASSGPAVSASILGTGADDSLFTNAISWSGIQNTARYLFAYIPGAGCSTLDAQAVGGAVVHLTNGVVGPALSQATGKPLKANWSIHNATTNGDWIAIAKESCVGTDCGVDTDAPELWLPNSQTIEMMSAISGTGGHGSMSRSYIQNAGNPTEWRRPIANLENAALIFQLPAAPHCCQDNHFNANILNDTDPIIAASGGPFPATGQPAQYYNEIYLMSVDGSMRGWRCCHTYSSGSSAAGFEGKYAIGAPNQPRTVFCFSSDMNGALGTITVAGMTSNRTDVFCAGLAGQ